MKLLDAKTLRLEIANDRLHGRTVGFVPTMGALHKGHLSLIDRARDENDRVVVSIFVNPLQFGPSEDLAIYPRDPEGDAAKCEDAGVDYLFAPSVDEIYPNGTIATRVDPGPIGETLEGQFRPGFFTGVATVCIKLFGLVVPDRAYFGQKDAQQLAVIRQVVADLDLPLEIVGCPTIRDPDGLAASSRNFYLDAAGREAALVLATALFTAEKTALAGEHNALALERLITETIGARPLVELQYVEVVDPKTFEPVELVEDSAVVVLAAFVRGTRLIDNVLIDLTHEEGTR
jgi:pantoate--beta-alanine ligase